MDPTTWTPRRALTFARGLYHVASSDGLRPAEADAIRAFCARVGLSARLEDLAAEPFDFAEAAEALDSPWLRRVFIDACRLLARVDGGVGEVERDALRAAAAALGLGEAAALGALPAGATSPGALATWIAAQPVDLIAWDDEARPAVFWDFPHPGHPLAEGGAVRVAPAQALVVHLDGEITDVVGPGERRLTREALPGLAARGDWRDGTVRARLTFVTTTTLPPWRWGSTEAIPVRVAGRTVDARAFGRYALRIVDPAAAFTRFARQGAPDVEDFRVRTRRMIAGRFAAALTALDDAPLSDPAALGERVAPALSAPLRDAGLELRRFLVESVTLPAGDVAGTPVPRPALDSRTNPGLLTPCGTCLTPTPAAARFCPKCGAPRARACGACAVPLPPAARFCPGCGTRAG
jgi:membrane protease subunit (stomatin/prohibitin family)